MKLTHTLSVECASEAELKEVKAILEKYEFTANGIKYIDKNYNKPFVGPQLQIMIKLKTKPKT